MNVKFLNPFVEAAYEVLHMETKYQTTQGEVKLGKSASITDDVTVILSLIGLAEGMVFYSMSEQTAKAFASAILGKEFTEFDGLAQSGIAELGNVITGRAVVKLSRAGYHASISPPTLLLGAGAQISTLDVPRITVPIESDKGGTLTIHLALREGKRRGLTTGQLNMPRAPESY